MKSVGNSDPENVHWARGQINGHINGLIPALLRGSHLLLF